MHRINNYGDNGSPCLIPLEGKIGSRASPLTIIDVDTIEM